MKRQNKKLKQLKKRLIAAKSELNKISWENTSLRSFNEQLRRQIEKAPTSIYVEWNNNPYLDQCGDITCRYGNVAIRRIVRREDIPHLEVVKELIKHSLAQEVFSHLEMVGWEDMLASINEVLK